MARADAAAGLAWLQGRIASDGSLSGEADGMALPVQSRTEVAVTLALADGAPQALLDGLATAPADDEPTEFLARRLLVLAPAGPRDLSTLIQVLRSRQNEDGGFGIAAAYSSNSLDTAWALLALRAVAVSEPAGAALQYLQSAQSAAGGFGVNGTDDAYISAQVLNAFHAYAGQYPLAPRIQTLVTFLQGRQTAPGVWEDSAFLSAAVYLALHDFIPVAPDAAGLRDFLLARQEAAGGWEGNDLYATALAVHALRAMATTPADPSLAILRGRILDGQTGAPLDGVTATLTGTGLSAPWTTVTMGGIFEFRQVPPGSYALALSFPDYAGLSATTVLAAGATVDLGELALTKPQGTTTGTLRGWVTDAISGLPLEGATIAVPASGATARTGADGSYQIADVTPGTLTVTADKLGYASASGTGTLSAGGVLLFSPALMPGSGPDTAARLEGTVTDATTGQPLAGVTVTATGANTAATATDSLGHYLLDDLPSGTTEFHATLDGYDPVTASADLAAGSLVLFSPRLYPVATSPPGANSAGVAGIVLDAGSNQPLADVDITATFGGTTRTLRSGADGRFTLGEIASATVDLRFGLAGYQGSALNVPLPPLTTLDVGQVRLRRERVEILLPDLRVETVTRAGAVTDSQTLALSGTLSARVVNAGTANAPAGVRLLAFHDADRNHRFDPATDVALGEAVLADSLAVAGSVLVDIPVGGTLPFRDAPVHVWVDSAETVPESDETNNLRSTADAAEIKPDIGTFQPVLKWHWAGSDVLPAYNQVMMAPAAAQTNDDNHDGRIDQRDVPDLIFVAYGGGGSNYGDGMLRIVSGQDGTELVAVADASLRLTSYGNLAVGDLDGDGLIDIVGPRKNGGLIAFNHDGSLKWTTPATAFRSGWSIGGPSIADLDGDGRAEVIYEKTVVNGDGSIRWTGSGGYIGTNHPYFDVPSSYSVVADLDLDGHPEVIAGASAYTADGTLLWQTTTAGDGFTGIGNFNDDPYPEIVLVSNTRVFLLDHRGGVLWGPVAVPGGLWGGAPTIADVDGDGSPEIGIAGGASYTVFRGDGSVLWSSKTTDASSGMTGSSVFDFDGDGTAEIAYADEYTLRIYRGANGDVVFSLPNTSGTAYELPVIADVDADHHADLVVVSNQYYGSAPGSTVGIRVFQDKNNRWVDTRRIWNQHSYHITNVNEDGSIPRVEENSWQIHNTYRLNARPGVSATAVPDLTASYLRVQDHGGVAPSAFTVRVGNGGGVTADPGVSVAFYSGDPAVGGTLLGIARTTAALESGEFEEVALDYGPALDGIADLYAGVDDDGAGHAALPDFDRSNNTVALPLGALPGSLAIRVVADQPAYPTAADAAFTATVSNAGSFAAPARVRFTVESTAGAPAAVPVTAAPVVVDPRATGAVTTTWNTGTTYAGSYRVRAELVDDSGRPYAADTAAFEIVAAGTGLVAARLHTDRAEYPPTDTVRLAERITNLSTNRMLEGWTVVTVVMAPDGTEFWSHSESLGQIVPAGDREPAYSLPLAMAPAGTYTVTLRVLDADGLERASTIAAFTVQSTADTGFGLTGTIAATPEPVPLGDPFRLTYTATNAGNAKLTAIRLIVRLLDPTAGILIREWQVTADLPLLGHYAGDQTHTGSGLAVGQTYAAVLYSAVGGTERVLAQTTFQIVEPPVRLAVDRQSITGRVLVLLNCQGEDEDGHDDPFTTQAGKPDGREDHGSACLEGRRALLERALTELGIRHRVETDPEVFHQAFRSGVYDTYWLSGGRVKLDGDLVRELREAVYRGEGLLLDGQHDERNSILDTVGGFLYRGQLGTPDLPVAFTAAPFEAQSLPSQGRGLKLQLAGGRTVAGFPTGTPAVVRNGYGAGRSLSFGFDLPASLAPEATYAAWREVLGAALTELKPMAPAAYTGGAYDLERFTVKNLAEAVTGLFRFRLPEGAALADSDPALNLETDGAWLWRCDLPAGASRELNLGLRLPTGDGLYGFTAHLDVVRNGVPGAYGDSAWQATVATAGSDGVTLRAALAAYQPAKIQDRQRRDRAVQALDQAETLAAASRWDAAIGKLLDAAELIAELPAPEVPDWRRQVARALQEYGRRGG